MTYEEFLEFVPSKCMYETIYDDSEGRTILVISMLDAYGMVNKLQRPWVGLTEAQFLEATRLAENGNYLVAFVRIQEWLKEKNT